MFGFPIPLILIPSLSRQIRYVCGSYLYNNRAASHNHSHSIVNINRYAVWIDRTIGLGWVWEAMYLTFMLRYVLYFPLYSFYSKRNQK